MKVDGLARKAPRRWVQVSRLRSPMVRHAGHCWKERGDIRPVAARRANPEGGIVTWSPLQISATLGYTQTSARTPCPGPQIKPRDFRGDAGAGRQDPRGAETRQSRGGPPTRGACRELIRPPARSRHRNHSAAPVSSACGNGPVALTSPDSAAASARASRLLPGGRRGAGRAAQGGARIAWEAGPGGAARTRLGEAVTGPPPSSPTLPAGADSLVSLGLSNCSAARRPPSPKPPQAGAAPVQLGGPRFQMPGSPARKLRS